MVLVCLVLDLVVEVVAGSSLTHPMSLVPQQYKLLEEWADTHQQGMKGVGEAEDELRYFQQAKICLQPSMEAPPVGLLEVLQGKMGQSITTQNHLNQSLYHH